MQAITFDFHNTLVECDPWFDLEVRHLPGAVLARLAGQGVIPATPEDSARANTHYATLRRAVMASGEEMDASACVNAVFAQMGIVADPVQIDGAIAALMRATLNDATLIAGARDTVLGLRERGYPLAIVSSAVYHPFLEWALDRFALAPAFDAVVTSASSGYYKSRREIFDLALDAVGGTAASSVHVGDSLRFDVGGAQRAGLKTVWLRRTERHPHTTGDVSCVPDLTVDSLVDATPAIVALLEGARSPVEPA